MQGKYWIIPESPTEQRGNKDSRNTMELSQNFNHKIWQNLENTVQKIKRYDKPFTL